MRTTLSLLLAASLLSSAASRAGCNLEAVAKLPVRVENGRLFIAGKIDDHPVDFLVDLGSPSILLKSAAVDFGIRPDKLGSLQEKAVLGTDHDGTTDSMEVEHLPIFLAGSLSNFGAPQEVAVLGMDFFGVYDVEFDVEHHLITLFNPTGCETTALAYWTRRYSAADMVANVNRINVPPYTAYNFPHVNFHVTVNGREMLAAFDPGYPDTALSFAAASTLGVGKGDETAPVHDLLDGYITRAWSGGIDKVTMDRETVGPARIGLRTFAVPVEVGPPKSGTLIGRHRYVGEDMVIGADFLLSHRVYVAYSQHKVYFSPAGDKPYLGAVPSVGPP